MFKKKYWRDTNNRNKKLRAKNNANADLIGKNETNHEIVGTGVDLENMLKNQGKA